MKQNATSVAAVYGGTAVAISHDQLGLVRSAGIGFEPGSSLNITGDCFRVKTANIPKMDVLEIAGTKRCLALGSLLKRNSDNELSPTTAMWYNEQGFKTLGEMVGFLMTQTLTVGEKEEIKVAKFADGTICRDENNEIVTVPGTRYGFTVSARVTE